MKTNVKINAQQAIQLKVGTVVRLVNDKNILGRVYNPKAAGGVVTIVRHDPGNNRFYFSMAQAEALRLGLPDYDYTTLERGEFVLDYPCIDCVVGNSKQTKFGKNDIVRYQQEAGLAKLKQELTIRIQNARTHLNIAASPKEFNAAMKLVKEQLRQATLIRQAIKE